jgi:hypothetical protein
VLPGIDLEWMYEQTGGAKVRSGGVITYGHLNTTDTELFAGTQAPVKGATHVLDVAADKLTTVAMDTVVFVSQRLPDGRLGTETEYKVRDHSRINDGSEVRLWLKEV